MNEEVMKRYNALHKDANAEFALQAQEIGGVECVTGVYQHEYDSKNPSDYAAVRAEIQRIIAAHYPASLEAELRAAAAESRQACGWATQPHMWTANGNRAGILAVVSAQDEIRSTLERSKAARTGRYESYRKLVEQGVALPPGSGG